MMKNWVATDFDSLHNKRGSQTVNLSRQGTKYLSGISARNQTDFYQKVRNKHNIFKNSKNA